MAPGPPWVSTVVVVDSRTPALQNRKGICAFISDLDQTAAKRLTVDNGPQKSRD